MMRNQVANNQRNAKGLKNFDLKNKIAYFGKIVRGLVANNLWHGFSAGDRVVM
jgi:hypothetical protein